MLVAGKQASQPADLDRGPAATGKTSLAAFLAKRRKPVLDDDGADAAIDWRRKFTAFAK